MGSREKLKEFLNGVLDGVFFGVLTCFAIKVIQDPSITRKPLFPVVVFLAILGVITFIETSLKGDHV